MIYNILIKDIRLPFTVPYENAISIAKNMLRGKYNIVNAYIYRKSIDARKKSNIIFVYSVVVSVEAVTVDENYTLIYNESDFDTDISYGDDILSAPPVITGFGPCGIFCALILAEHGYNPIVIERGGDIDERIQKVDEFYNSCTLDTESNIQFGAGGAGTFSDGKLTTRINDKKCRYILESFHKFGAPDNILTDSKPHIGTDNLREIIKKLKTRIIELGGTIHFNTKLTNIYYNNKSAEKISTNNSEIPCGALVLATGHSARDVYKLLQNDNYSIDNKSFSVGVRIEHLREDINNAMYGDNAGNPLLDAADYAYSHRTDNKAVYTFCMCPGGEVIAAASEEGGVVTNGMSSYNRDGRNSNSALVVSVSPDDPMEYQRKLEHLAFVAGGKNYHAPIQTVGDFMNAVSKTEPSRVTPSYMNGKYTLYDLNRLFSHDINQMLKLGLKEFNRKLDGFSSPDSIITGVESRTSAPYRITRDENYTAVGYDNIYPCGEGAGYAGGIMSAAVDGINCAIKIMQRYKGR